MRNLTERRCRCLKVGPIYCQDSLQVGTPAPEFCMYWSLSKAFRVVSYLPFVSFASNIWMSCYFFCFFSLVQFHIGKISRKLYHYNLLLSFS